MKKLTRQDLFGVHTIEEFLYLKFGTNTKQREQFDKTTSNFLFVEDENPISSVFALVENGNLTSSEIRFLAAWLQRNLQEYTSFSLAGNSVCPFMQISGIVTQIGEAEQSLDYAILCDAISLIKQMLYVQAVAHSFLFEIMSGDIWNKLKHQVRTAFESSKIKIEQEVTIPSTFTYNEPEKTDKYW